MQQGDVIAANVRLDRLLSEGGMGSVWVADHLTLNTQVAVKFMSAEMAHHAEAIARFTREASAAAQIRSPHIVQVFDHGVTAEGVPYIVMELLQGEDLDTRLGRGPLSLRDTIQVIGQVCKALGRAHKEGIVHRDIKPANIFLLDSDGDIFVKVLDFGIAKRALDDGRVSDVTRTGAMMGTPKYMSPEQMLSSKDIDYRSDLWAVGVVAYVCLTGVPPFVGETLGALSVAVNAARFSPPSALLASLPASIDAWFARALARFPEDRFASAKEMAEAMVAAAPKDVRRSLPPARDAPLPAKPGADVTDTMLLAATSPAARSAPDEARSSRARIMVMVGGVIVLLVGGAAVVFHQLGQSRAAAGVDPGPSSSEAVSAAPPATGAPVAVGTAPAASSPAVVPAASAPTDREPQPVRARPPTTSSAAAAGRRPGRTATTGAAATAPPPPPSLPAPTAVVKDRGF
jgi:serine/threonine-protein kinase